MLQRLSSTDKKEVEFVLGRDSVIQEAVFWTECHITWNIFPPFAIAVNALHSPFFAHCLVRVTHEWKELGIKGWLIVLGGFLRCVCFLLVVMIPVEKDGSGHSWMLSVYLLVCMYV